MKFNERQLRLYAVTDSGRLPGRSLARQVEGVLKGGATMVQLREKHLSRERLRAEALEIQALCRTYGVPFLINDDVELTLEVDADGVHVGQEDMEAGQVRQRLGAGKILGVSAHTVSEALQAQAAGADYLGAGAVFPTGTKGNVTPLPYETLRDICGSVTIPVAAIGGIGPDNLPALAGSGIRGVAVVSALFAQPDPEGAARRLRALAETLVSP